MRKVLAYDCRLMYASLCVQSVPSKEFDEEWGLDRSLTLVIAIRVRPTRIYESQADLWVQTYPQHLLFPLSVTGSHVCVRFQICTGAA